MIALIILFLSLLFTFQLFKKYRNTPPGPSGLPLVGYYPFLGKSPNQTIYQLSKQYGNVMSINLFGNTYWILNSREAIEEAFVQKGHIFSGTTSDEYGLFNELFKDTVGLDEGEEWTAKKKFILANLSKLGMGKSEFEMTIHNILDDMERYIDSINEQPHDYSNVLHNYALQVITQLMFGQRFELNDPNYGKIINWYKNIRSCFKYMNVFLSGNVFRLFVNCFTNYPKVLQKNVTEFEEFANSVIEARVAYFDDNNCSDFIDYWIKESRSSKQQFKTSHLSKEIVTMLFANQTAAAHLNLFMCAAALHPNIQSKIFHEIEETLGTRSDISFLDKDRMPFTQAVINENERFVAFANFSGVHVNTVPTTIAGFKVPKRQKVIANLYAMSRNEHQFSNPNSYDPNNFLDENGSFKPNSGYSAFGIGTRKCLGMKLAEVEIFLAFVRLIQKFEWTLPEITDSPTLTPGNVRFIHGFKLCARRRI